MSQNSIVKQTVDLIQLENTDLNSTLSVLENEFFGKLCTNLYGKYNRKAAFKLKMAFKRNTRNYRTLVETELKNDLRNESFEFPYLEWQNHLKHDLSKKVSRKEFLSNFHNNLAKKLQDRGN